MINLSELTIKKTHEHFKNGDFTVQELVNEYKKVIEEKDKKGQKINAYREVFDDLDQQAKIAQEKFNDGSASLMTGIPIAVKDNILIKGRKSGASSKILENYTATYDATVVEKLKKEGVVFLGRLNMDEFAMGGSTENSAYGVTKNPHDTSRVSGGSSGGSAAAVAMNGALITLGSDTGGSIREPASFCGIVGLKPTYGSVSRSGLIAMASSLDVIGSLAKTTGDAEIVFNVIKGKDPLDSTTVDLNSGADSETDKVKTIGIPRDFLKGDAGIDERVLKNFEESLEKLEKEGSYEIKDIELPNIDKSLAVYYVLMPAEVSSNMARFDGVKYGSKVDGEDLLGDYLNTRGQLLGQEVKRRIILGTYVLSAGYSDEYYNKAWQVRNLLRSDFEKAFKDVDIIALPTVPMPAFKIGEKSDPLQMYLADIFTVTANLTGNPAISIPSGFMTEEGKELPIGLQFIAPHLKEQQLFEVGKKFETIR